MIFQTNLNIIYFTSKMIFVCALVSLLLLPILSLKEMKPKLCINCKHFITDDRTGKFGKCSLFPTRKPSDLYDLVTGVERNTEYMYCSTTRDRDNLCGKEGKMYTKKYTKRGILKEKDKYKGEETYYIV